MTICHFQKQIAAVLLLVCASVLTICPTLSAEEVLQELVKDSTNEVTLTNNEDTCTPPTRRYPNLLVSIDTINSISQFSDLKDVFQIKRNSTQVRFPRSSDALELPSPSTARLHMYYSKMDNNPCCRTEQFIIVPTSVVSMYTGKVYDVKEYGSYKQLVHIGQCATLGASCSTRGTCQVTNRVQWILVDLGNGSDSYVPVSVPNHCFCRYH